MTRGQSSKQRGQQTQMLPERETPAQGFEETRGSRGTEQREGAALSRGWGRLCDTGIGDETSLCVPRVLQGSERGAGQHRPSFCCRKIRMS